MLKKILASSIVFCSLYSANSFSDELEDLYEDLKLSITPEQQTSITEKGTLDEISKEIDSLKKENIVVLDDKNDLTDDNRVIGKINNIDKLDADLEDLNTDNLSNEQYLKYFPVDTSFVFNYDIYIPRNKSTFIYSNGERVLNVTKTNFSLCYIKFNEYDKPRKISKGRKIYVDSNVTSTIKVKSTNQNIYFTTFGIDNEHISYIKCMSDSSKKPITLNDFYTNFGKLINVELPEYEQI